MKLFGGKGHNSNDGINTEYDRGQKETKKAPKKKSIGKGIAIAFAVIALLVGGGVLYWTITTAPPEVEVPPVNDPNDSIVNNEVNNKVERYYTLLLIGEDQEGWNTDTLMLMRFDTQELKADIVSIPRDTLINISESVKKINGVYYSQTEGGVDRLKLEVEKISGIRPNNYVIVNIDAFEKIIEAIGGVWFDVPVDMHYTHYDAITGEPFDINVDAGYNLLNGHDAMGVWRFRDTYTGGDLERISVQHDLLFAIAGTVMDLGLSDWSKLLKVAQIGFEYCETDLALVNVQWYAQQFLKMDMESLSIHTAPVTGCFVSNTNMTNPPSYVTLNVDEWIEMINTSINPYNTPIKAEDCEIVYAKEKELIGYQYYVNPSDLALTNGLQVYTNFYGA